MSNAAVERALERFAALPVAAGEAVVRQDEPADRFYIIESGSFAVRQVDADGDVHELRRLGPDDVFGELGLLSGAPRGATVVALSDGVVLALDGADFLDLVGRRTAVRGRLLSLYEPAASPTP